MGRKAHDLSGKRFGKLVAISRDGSYRSHPMWKCVCDCGNECVKLGARLTSGKTKSCGCLTTATHGLSKHPLANVRNSMVQRCYNPNTRSYSSYGGKGITVCDEWRHSSEAFLKWAVPLWAPGLTLDRIDSSLGYCPANCRFIPLTDNVLRKNITGTNIGRVVNDWEAIERVPGKDRLRLRCIHCKTLKIACQSNFPSGRVARCKCTKL